MTRRISGYFLSKRKVGRYLYILSLLTSAYSGPASASVMRFRTIVSFSRYGISENSFFLMAALYILVIGFYCVYYNIFQHAVAVKNPTVG